MISQDAPAKINCTLEILGRRADGFHDLASVVQTIDLADRLSFELRDDREILVDTTEPRLAAAPQDNLVWRAARLLQQVRQVPRGARIRLEKRIPLAAGLGGGSSDAAATLRGLNALWALGLQPAELLNLASLLGSDAAFFVRGGTALMAGRGEQITPLRPLAGGWFVLVTPPLFLADKTRRVYGFMRPHEYSNGVITQRLADTLAAGTLPPRTLFYNGLEDAAFRAFDALDAVRQQVVAAGSDAVRVAGAGPSLFVYCAEEAAARTLLAALQAADIPALLAAPVGASFEF